MGPGAGGLIQECDTLVLEPLKRGIDIINLIGNMVDTFATLGDEPGDYTLF